MYLAIYITGFGLWQQQRNYLAAMLLKPLAYNH